MSAKRTTLVCLTVLAISVFAVPAVFAQTGNPNPSGGTSGCRRVTGEGPAPSVGLVSSNVSIDLALRSWLTTFAARIATSPTRPGSTWMSKAVLARRTSGR